MFLPFPLPCPGLDVFLSGLIGLNAAAPSDKDAIKKKINQNKVFSKYKTNYFMIYTSQW